MLKITKNKVKLGLHNYSVRIMGGAGTGKTTLMGAMIKEMERREGKENLGVLLATEDGYKHIDDIAVINPIDKKTGMEKAYHDSWVDMNNTVNMIVKEKQADPHNFPIKFVVIDTTTNLESHITKKLEAEHGKTLNAILGGFGRGQKEVNNTIKENVIDKLKKNNLVPWYISHTRVKGQKDKLTDEEYVIIGADGSEGFDGTILKDLDVSMMIVKENTINGKRVENTIRKLVFREDGLHKACKSRFLNVPEYIILGDDPDENARTIIDILENAIKGQTKMNDAEYKQALEQQKIEDVKKEAMMVEVAKLEEADQVLADSKKKVVEFVETSANSNPTAWSSWLASFNGIDGFRATVNNADEVYIGQLMTALNI